MNTLNTKLSLLLILTLTAGNCLRAAEVVDQPNFLFIAVDDLNDFSGYAAEEPGNFLQTIYPDRAARHEVRRRLTPNLDRLAAEGAPFLRAYCASALCGPSRATLLTGVLPHQSGYYQHREHFRLNPRLQDVVTLPQQLKAHGYFTAGLGKVFHTGQGTVEGPLKNDWADARHSWSQWVNHPIGCGGGETGKYSPPGGGLMQFGPSRLSLEEAADYQAADFTARLLEHGTATTVALGRRGNSGPQTVTLPQNQPFFLACGLFRPHLPFYAPQPFFDRFPTEEMIGLNRDTLDGIIADLEDLPTGARRFSDYGNGKMKTVMEHARTLGGTKAEIPAWRDTVQAYLACVSFADACIGRILDGLDKSPQKDNTVVVLWSDHGYHLGAKYHIAKQALWEESNRVLLIIRDPRSPASCKGIPRRQIVGLRDLYPTLCDLAGVPVPRQVIGNSLVPLLANPSAPEVNDNLLMTYQEGNHSLRTANHRFMRYQDGSLELYEMIQDPAQRNNLAAQPETTVLREQLVAELDLQVQGEIRSGRNQPDGQKSNPAPPAGIKQVVFKGTTSTHRWELKKINPALPSDWTGYHYLVLEMKASSPQRFNLELISGELTQGRRLHLLPNVWIRAAVPLHYYREPNRSGHDLASIGKVPRASFWVSTGGTYGPLDAVTALGVSMQQPLDAPTLEIRSVRLAKNDPGSDILDPKPVVDEFGQWMPVNWPDKVKKLDQLQTEWEVEEAHLHPGDFGWCSYGGYLNTRAKATGFFRVEQVGDRWWFVDPDGHHFFSTSVTCVRNSAGESRWEGREDYYAAFPPQDTVDGNRSAPGFHTWNLVRRHGPDPDGRAKWMDFTVRRLEAWGLNTIGNWSDSRLWDTHRKAYQVNLGGWGMREGYLGLPDVYSDEFVQTADRVAAAQCAPRKSDPWLLGYFIANEPPWPGRESLVVDIILDGRPSAIQREVLAFLAQGDTPERRRQFIYQAFDRFLEVTMAAIRRHDPNHLILGLRFGGHVPPLEMLRASRVFDVYSLNVYSTQVDETTLAEIYRVTGRPILVGEFHFGVPGRGLAPGLVQVRDLAERGVAYRNYVEQAAAFPAFIGTSWFQWIDQPCTGRMDGENYNIGLIDVTDRPYAEMVEAMQTTHRRLQSVHAGTTPPFDTKPRPQ